MNAHSSLWASFVDLVVPEGCLVVAISAVYFDESGTHEGSPVMSLAGYVFTREQAIKFSRDWQKDLIDLKLPCAHMTDCATGNGDYASMTMEERVACEKRLILRIKQRSQMGLSTAVSPTQFDEIMGPYTDRISAYTMLLMIAVVQVGDWARERGFKGRFVYIFEAGHRHASEANFYMNALASLGPGAGPNEFYGGHAFLEKHQALPLQAADMLAWFHRDNVMKRMRGVTKRRKDFAALLRPVDLGSHVQPEELHELRQMAEEGVGIFETLPPRLLRLLAKSEEQQP